MYVFDYLSIFRMMCLVFCIKRTTLNDWTIYVLTVVNYQVTYFEELEVFRKNYLDIHAYEWSPRVHNVFNIIRLWFPLQLLWSC